LNKAVEMQRLEIEALENTNANNNIEIEQLKNINTVVIIIIIITTTVIIMITFITIQQELQNIAEGFLDKIQTLENEKQELVNHINGISNNDIISNHDVKIEELIEFQNQRISDLEAANLELSNLRGISDNLKIGKNELENCNMGLQADLMRLKKSNEDLINRKKDLENEIEDIKRINNELINGKKDLEKIVYDQLDLIKDLSGKVEETTALQRNLLEKKNKVNDLYKDLNEAKELNFFQKVTIDSNTKVINGLEEEVKNLKVIINENKKGFYIQIENLNNEILKKKKVIGYYDINYLY